MLQKHCQKMVYNNQVAENYRGMLDLVCRLN